MESLEPRKHRPSPTKQILDPSPRKFCRSLLAVVSITALFSILILAFKIDASISYNNATDNSHVISSISLRPDGENGGLTLALYPRHLSRGAPALTLTGGSISLVLAVSIGLICVFIRRRAKALLVSGSQRLVIFSALCANCMLSLIIFIVCSDKHFQSSTFDPSYRSPISNYKTYGLGSEYDHGTFDLGSWSCQLSAYEAFHNDGHVLLRQCVDETAALWIGLLLALSNLVMVSLVWMDWRGRRLLFRSLKEVVDGYEIDYVGARDLYT